MACQMAAKQFFWQSIKVVLCMVPVQLLFSSKALSCSKEETSMARVVREIIFILPLGVYAPNFTQVPLKPPRAHRHITPHPFIDEVSIVRALNASPD